MNDVLQHTGPRKRVDGRSRQPKKCKKQNEMPRVEVRRTEACFGVRDLACVGTGGLGGRRCVSGAWWEIVVLRMTHFLVYTVGRYVFPLSITLSRTLSNLVEGLSGPLTVSNRLIKTVIQPLGTTFTSYCTFSSVRQVLEV